MLPNKLTKDVKDFRLNLKVLLFTNQPTCWPSLTGLDARDHLRPRCWRILKEQEWRIFCRMWSNYILSGQWSFQVWQKGQCRKSGFSLDAQKGFTYWTFFCRKWWEAELLHRDLPSWPCYQALWFRWERCFDNIINAYVALLHYIRAHAKGIYYQQHQPLPSVFVFFSY